MPDEVKAKERNGSSDNVWHELQSVTRPILVDIAVFALIMIGLWLGAFGLQTLQRFGYDKSKLTTLEIIHYWSYTVVYGLFALDMIIKITLALFLRSFINLRRSDAQ